MSQPRVLMISVSAGSGHVRAAQALLQAAEQFPIEAQHIDAMDYVPSSFRKIYTDFYMHLVRHAPAFWSYLYKKTDAAQPSDTSSVVRRAVERLSTKKLIEAINQFKPDHIICTHFLPAELLSRERRIGNITCPVWVQVTDFDLHNLWVQQDMSGYFVANNQVAFKLQERGIEASKIVVSGIAISSDFMGEFDAPAIRKQLGLQPDVTTALVLTGGVNIGTVTEITERLLRNNPTLQVIAVSGKNAERLAELQQLATHYPTRLCVIEFSKTIQQLMAASDVVVTKPGGLTSSECLAMGLPMIVIDPIPGQEERNGDYLMELGAAIKAHDLSSLDYKMQQCLAESMRLETMRHQLLINAKPDAAVDILAQVLL